MATFWGGRIEGSIGLEVEYIGGEYRFMYIRDHVAENGGEFLKMWKLWQKTPREIEKEIDRPCIVLEPCIRDLIEQD